jgi:hypothetical protein
MSFLNIVLCVTFVAAITTCVKNFIWLHRVWREYLLSLNEDEND